MKKVPVENCCGCTACYNVCPKAAIQMLPDEEGFLYPRINEEFCIDCDACVRVCPVLNRKSIDGTILDAYALRTNNEKDLDISTSGGFTTPLAQWVFSQRGKFWAATFNCDWSVRHAGFCSADGAFSRTRGSKYVQSDLGDSFHQIETGLKNGELICFVGTTCQVYGLKSYLGTEYDNLITVDLVCHGTPSPMLWKKYINHQQERYGAGLKEINFRNKTYGYHSGTMMLQFDNGKRYTGSARVDPMLRSFFSEISSRPSCYACVFKERNRVSDFTIFDCWHMSELVPGQHDDDKGYTNVLVHSEKGRRVFNQIRNFYTVYSVDADKAIAFDGVMIEHSAKPHPGRKDFYCDIDLHDLKTHVEKHTGLKRVDYLLEKSKIIACKLGLMGALRKVKECFSAKP